MKRRWLGRLTVLVLIVAVSGGPAWAQDDGTAALRGRITDEAGAGLSGADVVATNQATGAELRAVADQAGDYRLEGLRAGPYTVRVEALGYRAAERRAATLSNQPVSIR